MAATVQPQTRQFELAHVLVLDLADASSLPASRHRVQLDDLQEFVRRTSKFSGALAKDPIGMSPSRDGMVLVFYGDPEAPLRCAMEISRQARSAKRIHLRMGLHSWPVSS